MSSQVASLAKSFPAAYEPRAVQSEIMGRIDDALSSGFRHIILCAPTGIGKSHIAMAFARATGSSHTLTAQKVLQDQYTGDFAWVRPLKGKSNFPCLVLCEQAGTGTDAASGDDALSCSRANCSWKEVAAGGRKRTVYCEHKPMPTQYAVDGRGTEAESIKALTEGQKCHYYDQKYIALNASHTVFNYAAYFLTRKYPPSGAADMLKRRSIIADEAHEIEDQLIDMIGMDIYRSHLSDVNLRMSDYATDDVDGVKKMVEHVADVYHEAVAEMEESGKGDAAGDRQDSAVARYRRRRDDLDAIRHELDSAPENMIVQPTESGGISIKPLEVGAHARRFFDMDRQLYMSATVHREIFCKTMGLEDKDCAFIEIERSPFPAKSREVRFMDVRRLNARSTEEDYVAVYSTVAGILRNHAGEKGLILTSRKDHCDAIAAHVRSELGAAEAARLRILHNDSGQEREQTLAEHGQDGDPSVLVSPSLWYGVDLKDDLSRFQIIIKTPYLSLGDRRTMAKMKRDDVWYRYAALTKLLQGMGRSVRSADDHAVTYILDAGARDLVQRMRRYVPSSYMDVLGGVLG